MMTLAYRATLTVHYMSETERKISFPSAQEVSSLIGWIEKGMRSRYLLLEMGDRVIAIPSHSVKEIEISPPPPNLLKFAFRDVTEVL